MQRLWMNFRTNKSRIDDVHVESRMFGIKMFSLKRKWFSWKPHRMDKTFCLCFIKLLCIINFHVVYGAVVGTNMVETHLSVKCTGVAKPAGGCHETDTHWVVSVYECAQRCRQDVTCLTLFFRGVSRDRLECALSARVYSCHDLTDGAFVSAQMVRSYYFVH